MCGTIDHARARLHNMRSGESVTTSTTLSSRQATIDSVHSLVGDDLDFLFQAVVRYTHPFRVGGGGVSSQCGPSEGYSMDSGITRAVVEALVDAGTRLLALVDGLCSRHRCCWPWCVCCALARRRRSQSSLPFIARGLHF